MDLRQVHEFCWMLNLLAVEKRAVSTIEIMQEVLPALEGHLCVMATYRRIIDVDIAIGVSADDDRILTKRAPFFLDSLVS